MEISMITLFKNYVRDQKEKALLKLVLVARFFS